MKPIEIFLSKGRFIVCDFKEFDRLNSKGFGFREGSKGYLSPYEALYLFENNKVKLDIKISFENLLKKLRISLQKYLVFKDLRSKGYILKTGMKYGFTFRVYDRGYRESSKVHSKWLLEILSQNEKVKSEDLLGKNRIAHSTKKKMLIAFVDDDNSVTYVENEWRKV